MSHAQGNRQNTKLAGAIALALALLLSGTTARVDARRCSGVDFPDSVDVDGRRLVLNGLGIREASAFQVNVYVAGLYLERRTRDAAEAVGSEQRKRLVLRMVRDVEKSDIANAFDEGFRINAGTERLGLEAEITQLLEMMRDLPEGATMTFTYRPGQGLEVEIEGQVVGTVAGGPTFQRAFFSLFMGPRPPNAGLRTGLLGGRCR